MNRDLGRLTENYRALHQRTNSLELDYGLAMSAYDEEIRSVQYNEIVTALALIAREDESRTHRAAHVKTLLQKDSIFSDLCLHKERAHHELSIVMSTHQAEKDQLLSRAEHFEQKLEKTQEELAGERAAGIKSWDFIVTLNKRIKGYESETEALRF